MILEQHDKILVSHRRLFPDDQSRFFIAEVEDYESGIVAASGYTWVRDPFSGDYLRKEDLRTKVFALASGSMIVYRLPRTMPLQAMRIESVGDHGHVLVGEGGFRMDLSERVSRDEANRAA